MKHTDMAPSKTSLAFVESLTLPLMQEVVISADVRCRECQKRVTAVISRLNGETESVVVNLIEKKVTVTCKHHPLKITPNPSRCGLLRTFFQWFE